MNSYYDTKLQILKESYDKKYTSQNICNTLSSVGVTIDHAIRKPKKVNIFKRILTKLKNKKHKKLTYEYLTNKYTHVCKAYCGADAVIMFNNKVIGDLQGVRFYNPTELERSMLQLSDYYDKELAIQKPVVIYAEKILFGKWNNEDNQLDEHENYDIVVTLCNESGISHYFTIYDAQLLHNIGSIDVDEVLITSKACMCGKSVTKLLTSVGIE